MKLTVAFWTKIAAWSALVAIVVLTLVPIGLRPTTPYSPNIERFFVMAAAGTLFGAAYPKKFWMFWVAVLGGALIELLQFLSVSRHPALFDAAIKSVGAGAGIVIGRILGTGAALIEQSNLKRLFEKSSS